MFPRPRKMVSKLLMAVLPLTRTKLNRTTVADLNRRGMEKRPVLVNL